MSRDRGNTLRAEAGASPVPVTVIVICRSASPENGGDTTKAGYNYNRG